MAEDLDQLSRRKLSFTLPGVTSVASTFGNCQNHNTGQRQYVFYVGQFVGDILMSQIDN